MKCDHSNRHALITGGSGGIGLATAKALAEEGARITIVSRSVDRLAKAAHDIETETGTKPAVIAADLSTNAGIALVVAGSGPIDILVNNAGAIPPGDLAGIDDATWRSAWDLKVFGYINLTRAYAPQIAQSKGVIVNVIGAGAESLSPGYICGAVGNAALVAFTKAYAKQFAKMGGRIVGLNPGAVGTERMLLFLKQQARETLGDESRFAEMTADLPYGRSATPSEIADAVVFLASDRSAYTNGTVLSIHGGL